MSLYPETCALCKGWVYHRMEPCDCARRNHVFRVVRAADRFNQCVAEFPDDPGAWSEYLDALHDALEKCPGTRTYDLAQEARKEAGPC